MDTKQVELRVANLDCDHDASALARSLSDYPGLVDLKIYPKSAKVKISYDADAVDPETLKQKLQQSGFPSQEGRALAEPPALWRNAKVLTSVASGLLLLLGWLLNLAAAPASVSTGLYVAAILSGGYFFGREAWAALIFEHEIGIELLMAVAAVVAALMGEVAEGAILVFLYSISEAAEGYTEEKTRSAIKALMDLTPKTALVRREGREVEIPVEDVQVGDVFLVKPGQALATDGQVVEGRSSVNQAPVTGESVPVEKEPGATVFAGSINGQGPLAVRATKSFVDNTISRIISMVEEAQERKGQSQRWIERFGAHYSPAVLALGFFIALVGPLLYGGDWSDWVMRATVFIVAAAPCALVISIPITLVATLGTGARNGVLIKGGVYVEELARVKVVAMDKTGTLTGGEPAVTDVLSLNDPAGHAAQEIMALAAGIEQHSEHPLAQAIVRHAQSAGRAPVPVSDVRSLTGAGISARLDGRAVYVGSPALFQRLHLPLTGAETPIEWLQGEGKTVVLVGDERGPQGVIALRDTVRPNAPQALQSLHAAGIATIVMLTGDNRRTAQSVARELGIDEIYADLTPAEKVAKVRQLADRHGHVAMVGDGVNDAPALAEATVGIAMGAVGTDVALETADVALMADDLDKLAYAVRLAKRNQTVVRQNLVLSAVVITTLVIGAVAGLFTLPVAVLGHEISEFVVIGSGLRMLRG